MEKDPKLSKLIRESGPEHAPQGFSRKVMEQIHSIPEQKAYRPLIGRWGRTIILLFFVGVIAAAFLLAGSGEASGELSERIPQMNWSLPQIEFKLDFLKQMHLSTGVVSALVALSVLLFFDTALRHRRHQLRG